eukprot:145089_1
MYQRLLKYDINAAKKIVLPNINTNTDTQTINEYKTNDNEINYKIDHDLCRLSGIYNKKESEFVDSGYVALEDSDSDYYTEEDEEESVTTEYHSSDDENSPIANEIEEEEEKEEYNNMDYKLVVDTSTGEGLEIKMKIDINLKHKLIFLITNKTQYNIYQIDMKCNKNYLGVQSLKTLLNNNEIIKINNTKKIIIPLKLIEKSHENIPINKQSMRIQTAIRYFQQICNDKTKQSNVIFFNVCIPPWIFFNQFKDNTANNNYTNKVNTMKSISRKCQINIKVKDNDNTELIIHNVLLNMLKCKKIKELKQENDKKIIYMALLQFKWILIGVCIHNPIIKGKRKYKNKNILIDIITKSNTQWQSEATMQAVKFAILSERHFIGSIQ